jgi:hypothetical protein
VYRYDTVPSHISFPISNLYCERNTQHSSIFDLILFYNSNHFHRKDKLKLRKAIEDEKTKALQLYEGDRDKMRLTRRPLIAKVEDAQLEDGKP